MRSRIMQAIAKALPGHFRWVHFYADLEGPAELILALCPPDIDVIRESKGLLKEPENVAEFDGDEDLIFIWPEHYERLLPVFQEALRKAQITEVRIINYPMSISGMMFWYRCRQYS